MEGDVVSLSPSLHVESYYLYDLTNGARHKLIDKSLVALRLLEYPIRASDWLTEMYENEILSDQISEMIIFLNSIGALNIKRTLISDIRSACMRFGYRLYGIRMVSFAKRRRSGFAGLNISILNAMVPVIILVLVTSILEYGAGFKDQIYINGNIIFVICLWLSTAAHEYVHIRLSITNTVHPVVLQRGLRIGILHRPLSDSRGLVSALGGPLAGFLVALFIGAIVAIVGNQIVTASFALSVALFHLVSWLPVYGDGQALVKSIRRYYATTS